MAEPIAESGNLTVAMSGMVQEFTAITGRRVSRFDQLAADSSAMWSNFLTSPTVLAGMGYQAAAGHMPPRQTEAGLAPAAATSAPPAK